MESNFKENGEIYINFQDLQNESCTARLDTMKNIWIGRNSYPKINISIDDLEFILSQFRQII